MLNKKLINTVKDIISPVYLVGGAVRDLQLNRSVTDYDFTTPHTPEIIEQAIRNYGKKPYLIGKRYGTLGFRYEGKVIEITTFRTENYKKGCRKPSVEFVGDITADLSRRDFTINAMAMRDGRLIDPFNGLDDIQNKTIRYVGIPKHRIKEDPLRMLRMARFCSQLGFLPASYNEKLSYKILEVSKERWVTELDKLLLGDSVEVGLEVLRDTRLLNYIIPELSLQFGYHQNSKHHQFTLWGHTKKVVSATPKDINMRWSALLHDIAKPFTATSNKSGYANYIHHDILGADIVKRTAKHLNFSNDRTNSVVDIVLNHLDNESKLRKYDNMGKITV